MKIRIHQDKTVFIDSNSQKPDEKAKIKQDFDTNSNIPDNIPFSWNTSIIRHTFQPNMKIE